MTSERPAWAATGSMMTSESAVTAAAGLQRDSVMHAASVTTAAVI